MHLPDAWGLVHFAAAGAAHHAGQADGTPTEDEELPGADSARRTAGGRRVGGEYAFFFKTPGAHECDTLALHGALPV